MKFKFKIQQYQTDAVNSIVKVFDGQPFLDKIKYTRDLGIVKPQDRQCLYMKNHMKKVTSVLKMQKHVTDEARKKYKKSTS